jgi:hypothetical protein
MLGILVTFRLIELVRFKRGTKDMATRAKKANVPFKVVKDIVEGNR